MAATNILTEKKIVSMNKILRPKFGSSLLVTGGSYERDDDGKITRYHIVIGDSANKISQGQLLKMGETLKEEFDSSAEFYNYGDKIS